MAKTEPYMCGMCPRRDVVGVTEAYADDVGHDGRTFAVSIPDLTVLKCRACGNRVLPDEASDRISDALRRAAGLMLPDEIRANREAMGVSHEVLVSLLAVPGVGRATVRRWELGQQIQSFAADEALRTLFQSTLFQSNPRKADRVPTELE